MTEERFLQLSGHYLEQYLGKIRECTQLLTEEQIWWRPKAGCNSVGNLLLHLCGNLTQWVLDGLGGEQHERRRSLEFSADRIASGKELLARLAEVVASCRALVARLSTAELSAEKQIQGYDTDGVGVLFHAVEHMSYHTGQIVSLTKQLLGEGRSIEFYPQHRGE
jgi:uncharacterized damage-inducible protein DinB